MFKHTVKYTDYNDVPHEVDVYFNYSVPEMLKLQNSVPGGFGSYLEKIAKSNDPMVIYKTFEEMLEGAYGEKSDDGQSFVKVARDGHKLVDDFKQTPAWEAFICELLVNDKLAAEMVNKMIPSQMLQQLQNGGLAAATA